MKQTVVSSDYKRSHAFIRSFRNCDSVIGQVRTALTICAVFIRIGSITFGGGFVMIPLIEAEAVNSHHWLTHQEFADATALGQITPGPVLITPRSSVIAWRARLER